MPTLLDLPDDVLQGPLILIANHRLAVSDAFPSFMIRRSALVLSQTCRRLRTLLFPVLLRESRVVFLKPNIIPIRKNDSHGVPSTRLQRFHSAFLLNTPTPSPLLGNFRKLYLGSTGNDFIDGSIAQAFTRFEFYDSSDAQRLMDVVRILSPTIQSLSLWRVNHTAFLEEVCALFGMHGNLTELVVYFDFIGLRRGIEPRKFFRILGAFLGRLTQLRSLHIKFTGNTISELEISPISEGLFFLCDKLVSFCWEWRDSPGNMLDERDFAISSDDFLDTLIGQFVGACTSLRKVRLLAAPDRFFKQPFPSSRWADTLFKVIDQNKSTELLELELREKSNDERFVNRTWVLDAATVLKQDFSNLRSLTLGFSAVDKGGYDALGSAIATLPSLEKFILLFNGLDGNAGEMLPLFSGNSRASRLASLEVCLMHKANFCFNESDDDPLLEYIDALADAVAENGAITSLALRVFVSSFNILETLVDSLMRHASQMDSHVQALVLHIQLFHLLYQDERATSNFQRIWSTLLKFLVEMPSLHTLDLGGLLHKKLSRANRDAITAMMRKDVRDLSRNLTVLGLLE